MQLTVAIRPFASVTAEVDVTTLTGPAYGELIHRAVTLAGNRNRIAWMHLDRTPQSRCTTTEAGAGG